MRSLPPRYRLSQQAVITIPSEMEAFIRNNNFISYEGFPIPEVVKSILDQHSDISRVISWQELVPPALHVQLESRARNADIADILSQRSSESVWLGFREMSPRIFRMPGGAVRHGFSMKSSRKIDGRRWEFDFR